MSSATFTLRVAPRPQVSSLLRNPSGGCSISLVTVPGKLYRLEFKNSLQDSEWQPIQPDTTASTEVLNLTDNSLGIGQRFYRIAVLN